MMWGRLLLLTTALGVAAHAAIVITAGPDPSGDEQVESMMRNSQQRSWCRPGNIRQIITHEGCQSEEIENQVCAGSCFSYSLPQTRPETPGDRDLDFCESCQPSDSHWVNITLDCISEDETSYEISKRVQKISNCSCMTCPGQLPDAGDEVAYEQHHRIPDLLFRALPSTGQYFGDGAPEPMPASATQSSLEYADSSPVPLTLTTSPPITEHASPSAATATHGTTNSGPDTVLLADNNYPPFILTSVHSNDQTFYQFPGAILEHEHVGHPGHATEEESNPNLLSPIDPAQTNGYAPERRHGLASIMNNLNVLLRGEGPVQYERLSLIELKSVLDNLEPHQANELLGKTIYSADPVVEEGGSDI